MILGAFGDSFIWGTDLKDCCKFNGSKTTWPALLSNNLGLEYKCHASPGSGNRQILNNLLDVIGNYDFYIISWTWIDRYDYIDVLTDTWQTIRPSLDNKQIDEFYYKHLHSELQDKQTTLGIIYQAINLLESHNCKYLMTYMDPLMLDKQWHCPPGVDLLQNKIISKLSTFDELTFLEWAKTNNYTISERWHPLEEAHKKASEYMLPVVHHLLNS